MPEPLKLFLSYAHEDREACARLVKHLAALHRAGLISIWWDKGIPPGADWGREITDQLQTADIVLLVLTADFIASDFCYCIEMKQALDRERQGLTRVVPVMLDDCHWQETPFAKLSGLPTDMEPILPRPLHQHSIAFTEVAKGISLLVQQLNQRPRGAAPAPVPTNPPAAGGTDAGEAVPVPVSPDPKPAWLHQRGKDQYGPWESFAIDGEVQWLRWIPPGQFLMGSPGDDPDRFDDEGPQHPVTISRGFWLMDTPCTQALWQAVMGNNPSAFKSPERPVEMVSWNEVQEFIARINQRLPGLALTLPSEAEWEYACRAGSQAARYGELGDIAWYEDNSNRQTEPVGGKLPNRWGLRDMLGNVWERCRDGLRTYRNRAETDPVGLLDGGNDCVLRGGAWYSGSQFVHAAYRHEAPPDYGLSIGFRCSRVQVVSQASPGSD